MTKEVQFKINGENYYPTTDGKVLFSGDTVLSFTEDTTITLRENYTNFKRIRVYYGIFWGDNWNMQEFETSDTKHISLIYAYAMGDNKAINIKTCTISFNGSTATSSYQRHVCWCSKSDGTWYISTASTDTMHIKKIVGYK